MHVLQFLGELGLSDDVAIEVAPLPELLAVAFELARCFSLEGAEGIGEEVQFRLAEQQVDVVWHQDIAEDVELMTMAEGFEFTLEDCAGVVVVEVRQAVVTSESDEMPAA